MRFWILLFFLVTHSYYVLAVTLSGTVTNSDDGSPVIGALLLVRGTNILGVSGADGTYSLEVPAGVYGLTCTAAGFRGYHSSAIDLSQNTTRNINLNPAATGTFKITGTATCDSTPCGGVLVLVYSGDTLSAVGLTAPDTYGYSAEGLAEGTYSLTAVALGYLPQKQTDFVVAASGTPTFNPTLIAGAAAGYTVSGTVGLINNPLDRSGSRVIVNGDGSQPYDDTSASGGYTLIHVPAGLISFSATHAGYNRANHIDVLIENDNTTLDFVLNQGSGQTTPTYRLNGRITLEAAADGTTPSLLYSLVNFWTTDGSQHFSTVTDVDGYYVIENLPEGNYQAGAAHEGYQTSPPETFDLNANRTWSVQLEVNPSWDYGPGDRADLPGCSVGSSNDSLWMLIIGLLILLFSPPRT
jgi:hypothetical protein